MNLNARVATAIPLAVVCVSAVWYLPTTAFAVGIGTIVLLGAWEWSALAGFSRLLNRYLYVAALLVLGIGLLAVGGGSRQIPVAASAALFWVVALILVVATQWGRFQLQQWPRLRVIAGALVLLPTWHGLSSLHGRPDGPIQVLFLLFLIWSADIAAYFAGRAWGRSRLCSQVSPGKSWEGVWAAVFAAVVLGALFAGSQNLPAPAMLTFALLAALTVAASIIGDLLESMLKRSANLKDSGTLLPGHGGILDRIDSLTAAAPVYLLGLYCVETLV